MASRVVAAKRASTPKVLPPSSPFGELLRRSNFASYDPAIRQTYAAPPSYVHRGNWGLKRPIANRKRHSAIVLRQFEEHAHYIEWDKAPAQVDFIKRVEELNIQPKLEPNTPWSLSLGPGADAIDSDFVKPDSKKKRQEAAQPAASSSAAPELAPVPEDGPPVAFVPPRLPSRRRGSMPSKLSDLGNAGSGSYGARTVAQNVEVEGEAYIQPNIAAMTPHQFEEYLEELRALRPAFRAYIREELINKNDPEEKKAEEEEGRKSKLTDEELMFNLGTEAMEKSLHRYFLGKHTQEKFDAYRNAAIKDAQNAPAFANAPQPIQPQPHRLGGLVYSKPTRLETYYSGRAEPGIILQTIAPGTNDYFHRKRDGDFVTVFAGMSTRLHKDVAGTTVVPLLNPFTQEGLNVPLVANKDGTGSSIDLSESVRDMRMVELTLEAPPKVVGHHVPNQSMLGVKVDGRVVVDKAVDQNSRTNPHRPGSRKFNAAEAIAAKPTFTGTPSWSVFDLGRMASRVTRSPVVPTGQTPEMQKDNKDAMMHMLRVLTDKKPSQ